MEKRHFSLEMKESAKWSEWVQIAFGIICIVISIVLIFSLIKTASDKSSWIGIYFLVLFGIFQIWSGFGFAEKFIELESGKIRLKKSSIARPRVINAVEIEKIEAFPLNTIFRLKNNSKINLRFGINYPERNVAIVHELYLFAEENKILFEEKNELL